VTHLLCALQHFPFQGFRDSGIGSQGIKNSLALMVKHKATVINLSEYCCVCLSCQALLFTAMKLPHVKLTLS
jgi:hypothetical protein